jgi:transcriptional regulator GlxA family with amidase domain
MSKTIGIVIFPNVEELDFVGPWEVFTRVGADECRVFTVAQTTDPIRCSKGLRVLPDHSFENAPGIDILVVPGGLGARTVQLQNPAMLDFLRQRSAAASITVSVCTGAFLLEKIGLLHGRRATTHWWRIDALRSLPGITVENARSVDDGNIVTAAGVSAGIDASLYLVGRLWDKPLAARIQKDMEYFPEPPHPSV